MKACLVYPNFSGQEFPHTGLMLISAVLKAHGHDVMVADFTFGESMKNMRRKVLEFSPDVVGVTATAGEVDRILKFVALLKQGSSAPIVFGGPHTTMVPDKVIHNQLVDIVCLGEGEMAMLDLVNCLKHGNDYSTIPNLWVKWNGTIKKNPPRPPISDLDILPLPDWNLFDIKRYLSMNGMMSLLTGRGCLFKCSYCANHRLRELYDHYGRRYARKHSVDYTMRMIASITERFPVKHLAFNDDLFTMDQRWLDEFAKRFSSEYPGLKFHCTNRIEFSTPELFRTLAFAGCTNVRMAIEAGDETIRKNILNRHMTNKQIIEAFKIAKEAGITTTSYNILGSPYETTETMMKTLSINQAVQPSQVGVSICMPFPGTDIYDRCVREGLIDPDFEVPLQYRSKIVIKHTKEVVKAIKHLKRTFRYHVFKMVNWKKALAFLLFDNFHYYLYGIFVRLRRKFPFFARKYMLSLYWNVFTR